MKNTKIFIIAAAIACISLTACGTKAASSNDKTASGNSASTEETIAAIENPFVESDTVASAEENAGFKIKLPDTPEAYPETEIRSVKNELLEVIYKDQSGKEGFRIRKGAGTVDISGDYTKYDNEQTSKVGYYDVTTKGNGDTVSVVSWTDGKYAYAVDAQDYPLSIASASEIAQKMQ